MTLYYIIKTGRPFFSFCDNFMPGIFFSCVGCSFTLCRGCYTSSKCDHNRNGRTRYLDNYTLLQVTRDTTHATGIKKDKQPTTTSIIPTSEEPTTTSIVPTRKEKKWKVAFKVSTVIC
ncbi:uncharacterized protein LOC111371238 isoform X3 [Olea europaea var. sylvestris]|uniref:uncharacterized protein LOC111371238 isoform X3 n=1 Tax=Olea europaea var. sylvestris TaxID=158386 RepID=UPI000C1D78C0|nr:uncharacterized protein LOC111371238 isoform X3 [Olea europaea var. sylvestris]